MADYDEDVHLCEYCGLEKYDSEMSGIDAMCKDCYTKTLNGLKARAEVTKDYRLLSIFYSLTEG